MKIVAIGFLIIFIICERLLFWSIKKHYPEAYVKLGKPDTLNLSMNLFTIIKFWIFILGSNPFKEWPYMSNLFRLTQVSLLGLLISTIGVFLVK